MGALTWGSRSGWVWRVPSHCRHEDRQRRAAHEEELPSGPCTTHDLHCFRVPAQGCPGPQQTAGSDARVGAQGPDTAGRKRGTWPGILTQSSPWLSLAIKESSLRFKMPGGRIFFFQTPKSRGQTILNIPGYSPMHQLPWLAPGYSRSSVRRVNSACIIYPL